MKKLDLIYIISFVLVISFPIVSYPVLKKYDTKEIDENRTLAKFPTFSKDFGAHFDEYFNDNLPFRTNYIQLYSGIDGSINSAYQKLLKKFNLPHYIIKNKVVYGEDGWLFYYGDQSLDDYKGTNLPSDKELMEYANRLAKVDAYFKSQGKIFALVIAPNKEQIYSEYMPSGIVVENNIKRIDKIYEYLTENTSAVISYSKDTLLDHKDEYVYYKTDTHWNEYGSYLGTIELLNDLNLDFIECSEISRIEVGGGDLSIMINDTTVTDDVDYDIKYNFISSNDKSVYVAADSFFRLHSNHLLQYFGSENIVLDHYVNIEKNFTNGVLENSDIIIFECVERYEERMFSKDGVLQKIIDNYNL